MNEAELRAFIELLITEQHCSPGDCAIAQNSKAEYLRRKIAESGLDQVVQQDLLDRVIAEFAPD
ncbi:hypothetical protein OKA04_12250 [Luteolibacter flavescens]|uniref:Uncharacterized protein n=1 Tax=Luteolibacter flavescens TaxID=1859460 RepID=A0ABT3FPX8_9BACT|nr:hypothetical protein [Luteolibacter flavescens]MCW1885502.1 hypothetical protein [Luteolibacter flavescens]